MNPRLLSPYYLIPENLNLATLLNEVGYKDLAKPIHRDKFYYIIDMLYLRYVMNKIEWDEYLSVNARFVQNILTWRYNERIMDALVKCGVLECDGSYQANKRSYGYRFTPRYWVDNTKFCGVMVYDAKLIPKIATNRQVISEQYTKGHEGIGLIYRSLDEVSFDSLSAQRFLDLNEYEREGMLLRRRLTVEWFQTGGYTLVRDSYGRCHHLFTACSQDLRPFSSWKGHELFTVDVSCAQPAIAAFLYPSNSKEKSKYVEMVSANALYDELNSLLGNKANFKNPAEKKDFKQQAFAEIYFGSRYKKEDSPCLSVFKRLFPELSALIADAKTRHHRDLAHKIQRIEADLILNDAATKFAQNHRNNDVCLISIHDALVTTEGNVPEAKSLIEEAFQRHLGFRPKVNDQKLTGDWREARVGKSAEVVTKNWSIDSGKEMVPVQIIELEDRQIVNITAT